MRALKGVDINNMLFIDIETVRIADTLEPGTPLMDSWEYKMRYSREATEKFPEGEDLVTMFKDKAALYAEFAKIVCITIGKAKCSNLVGNDKLFLKSYSSDNEKELLTEFCNALQGLNAANPKMQLVGHAIKGFDIPFIMRRCMVNQLDIPALIDVADVKPWLMTALDTLELWKGTGFYSASLINIAVALGLPSPKQDMKGSETSEVFYREGKAGLERITRYCEQDVKTVCNIVRFIRGEAPLEIDNTEIKTEKTPLLTKIYNTKSITKKDEAAINKIMSESIEVEEIDIANHILDVTKPKTKK